MTATRNWLFLVTLIASAACASASPADATRVQPAPARDSVDFIVLGRGLRADCVGRQISGPACRVRDKVSIAEIRSRLAAGTAVWREGDALVFAYDGTETAVDLTGTLEYPMSRVAGTELWVVKLRIRDIDRAIISYAIHPLGVRSARAGNAAMPSWRGPAAPPPPSRAASLQGTVIADSIDSRALGHSRPVWAYLPPGTEPPDAVVYLGDGMAVTRLAPYVDTLITAGSLRRVMLVGMANTAGRPGDPPGMDPRALEYLWNHDTLNTRFLAHERFLLDEVMPWAESRHGAPPARERRAVFGMSNSGGWAMQMGLRNPDRFAHVIAFSPGGVRSGHMTPEMRLAPPVRFLLLSGTLEPEFNSVAQVWAKELAEKQLEHRVINVVAGHDWSVWRDEFGGALRWAFGQNTQ